MNNPKLMRRSAKVKSEAVGIPRHNFGIAYRIGVRNTVSKEEYRRKDKAAT